jgi:hypothetical protein
MPNANSATPRFIVGLPRSGTTWLCHSLNEHPDVAAFGETMFWGKAYIPPGANGHYDPATLQRVKQTLMAKPLESTIRIEGPGGLRNVSAANAAALIEEAFNEMPRNVGPAEVFSHVADRIARAEGKSAWTEKTPHHLLYARRILQHFPSARFVVLVREPYSFLLSYKHQSGHEKSASSQQRFRKRYHPLAGALVWRNTWRAAQTLLTSHPDQSMLVRMEDIANEPIDVMLRVHEFLNLRPIPGASATIGKINSTEKRLPAELSEADIAWINLLAAQDIQEAGYTVQNDGGGLQAIARSALDLPLWALRILHDLKRTTSGSLMQHLLQYVIQRPHP